jgi:hypothetical protein
VIEVQQLAALVAVEEKAFGVEELCCPAPYPPLECVVELDGEGDRGLGERGR